MSIRPPHRHAGRDLLVAAIPVALVVLAVVSLVTIAYGKDRAVAGTAEPVAVQRPLNDTPSPTATTTTTTTTTPSTPTEPPDNPAAAPAAVAAVDARATSDTDLGVAILDRTTGALSVGQEGATQFYSASVIKLFLIVDVLHDVETGQDTLDDDDTDLIQRALSRSDDNAMDALWEQFDGADAISQLISLAHLQNTQLPDDTSQWGETLISARDVVAVYQYALTSLNAADRDLVMTALGNAADSGADGFDQAFGLLNPPRPGTVKAKQGWMIYGSQMMLHSTGVLGSQDQYVVAVLSKQDTGIGWAAGRQVVDNAVGALLTALGPTALR
ncbi:MAG TPA: serine hydrolase [Pseudonocardiaceae bacterium]|nr:serine hydrolase [Pseudonocardiaceae bacterium]